MLPPSYVTINQNFNPIPQIYTPITTILIKKKFLENFPVFQENLYCVQNLDKNGFAGSLKCYLLAKWQLIKISIFFDNVHTKHCHSNQNEFLEYFPGFHKNLHWMQNSDKNGFSGILKCYPLAVIIDQSFSPIPQMYTPNTTILNEKIARFPEKHTFCGKLVHKWFCWDFEALPPDYVLINQNFNHIPEIYLPSTTILTEKKFWKISQFSRKTYIVCKIWTKMVLFGFWSVTPSYVTINKNVSSVPQTYTPNTTILTKKEFLKNFQGCQKTLYIVCKVGTLRFCWDFEVLPPDYVTIEIGVLFQRFTQQALPSWWKKF